MVTDFNYIQVVPSDTWTVTHNLNAFGVVTDAIVDNGGSLEKVFPSEVIETSANVVTILFSVPLAGRVRIIAATQ